MKNLHKHIKMKSGLSVLFAILSVMSGIAQTGTNLNFDVKSTFVPTIKDAVKFSDVPEIADTVKRVTDIRYGINSKPVFPKYAVQPIQPAKIQNEPLPKLYHSLLKAGYSPLYNMPYGEFWFNNVRSKEMNYGAKLRHFSSTTHLSDVAYGGFAENFAQVYGKRFYKKHTLSGEFNYSNDAVHYYGYDTSDVKISIARTRQRYQIIEPKLQLISHYTDSTHVNHDIGLSYYNLQNLHNERENNIRLKGAAGMFINKEKLNVGFLTDFYNHRQDHDTLNDLIATLAPSFEANGKKWHIDLGVAVTLDNFRGKNSFYFYPQLNMHYDIYESLIIPYATVSGGLLKNSMRSLAAENPFVDTSLNYRNTDNKFTVGGGLRGNLSSNTSYDVRASYSRLDSLYFFVNNFSDPADAYNRFSVVYDNATLFSLTGQVKYALREKINFIAKGGYYLYETKQLTRAYHKPDFDMNLAVIYNIRSKIIVRTDLYFMGNQWALSRNNDLLSPVKPRVIDGWADLNLETEYRYSKMLSFFVRLNNIAGQRYYRWEQYPSQKFSFMVGLTFVPF
jgi:hypothetical protein